jgi:hypothetical protein
MVKYLTMIITPLQGKFNQNEFFIYSAADEKYFDEFGKSLINSINANSNTPIHFHIFNPRPDQLEFCKNKNVSVTYEYVSIDMFKTAAKKLEELAVDQFGQDRKHRTLTAMAKGGDVSVLERMLKTYYACARFIRLAESVKSSQKLFAIDVDAIVRSPIKLLPDDADIYIHKNKQFLAGGLYLNGTDASYKFLKEYKDLLMVSIQHDIIYWSLDQDILDNIVPSYLYKELPRSYIDWNMLPTSIIWTAKGKRKDLEVFKQEKLKY